MKSRLFHVIKVNVFLFLAFIAYYLINKYTNFYIPCIFHEITGFKCPGCGVTRLLFALLNFNFVEAFKINPLVFIYLPFIITYYFYVNYLYVYNKKDKILIKVPNYIWGLVIAITILFGIIRNFY